MSTEAKGLSIIGTYKSPAHMLEQAHITAETIMDLAKQLGKDAVVRIGSSNHFTGNFWQALGHTAGIYARVVHVDFIERPGAQGYQVHAKAVHFESQQEVTECFAECLDNEANWDVRSVYEYKDGVKEKVADAKVPWPQLLAMAQTRACARALRQVFGFIISMAGYSPVAAEEMAGGPPIEETPRQPPKSTRTVQTPQQHPASPDKLITPNQVKMFWAVATKEANKGEDDIRAILTRFNCTTPEQIRMADFDAVLTELRRGDA